MTVGCSPSEGNASVKDLPQLGQNLTDASDGISFLQCRQNIFNDSYLLKMLTQTFYRSGEPHLIQYDESSLFVLPHFLTRDTTSPGLVFDASPIF